MAATSTLTTLGLLVGGLAVIGGLAAVGSAELLAGIVSPPPVVRAALVGAMTVVALWLGRASLERFRAAGVGRPGADLGEADPVVMLRGIRLAFLSLAAISAAAGWLVGHPLPLVVAAIIAAVDVVETSFLLLVVTVRGGAERR
jgi:hypothetical protein